MTPVVALTIAGSDSGGGAGAQADLLTFAAHGVHGACALSAVTAQNTNGVQGIVEIDPDFVAAQVRSVVSDLAVRAVKTGMLATGATVRCVTRLAADGVLPNLVVDPVLAATSGQPLLAREGVAAYRELLALATVVTPNLEEAAALTGRAPDDLGSIDAMAAAAAEIRSLGPTVVVVTGGHLAATPNGASRGSGVPGEVPDVVAGPHGVVVLRGARIDTLNDHGTGCTLSAAVAARLALGDDPLAAVRAARRYVRTALAGARGWRIGTGRGPLAHPRAPGRRVSAPSE